MATINDFMISPCCGKRFLGTSYFPKKGAKFCHRCHVFFTMDELMNFWGFDIGDFFDAPPHTNVQPPRTRFVGKEPVWESKQERDTSYQVVNRMWVNEPKWKYTRESLNLGGDLDYLDLKRTERDALNIGIQ